MTYRKEKDAISEVNVPVDAYYGSFTTRALSTFDISGITPFSHFRRAFCLVKKASLYANHELGLIENDKFEAIDKAINEFESGKFDDEYVLDYFQAGAGTPFNMNFNEIVANRANEILGGKKGRYEFVHPNNHVNMSQSSNDVVPTVVCVAAILYFREKLCVSVSELVQSFMKKAKEGGDVLKVGRTHLMDAVPVTLEQEIGAMGNNLKKALKVAEDSVSYLYEIGLGGTATGSGITTHPKFCETVVKYLRDFSGIEELWISEDLLEMTASMDSFAMFSASLRGIANSYIKIAGDLKILNMGPKGGIGEIILPEVEPGSSIMPGKVNPSACECLHMIGIEVSGFDAAINIAAQSGQLQLNYMAPLVMFNLEMSMKILAEGASMFKEHCVDDLEFNFDRISELLDGSLVFATGLVPYLGYQVVAEIVNEALESNSSIKDVVMDHGLMNEDQIVDVLSPSKVCNPSEIDVALRDLIQGSSAYKDYLVKIGK